MQSKPRRGAAGLLRVLQDAQDLLNAGRPKTSLARLDGLREGNDHIRNARAVCYMRLGHPERAVRVLRPLALVELQLRPNVPTVFAANLATALMLSGNVVGAERIVRELEERKAAEASGLRADISRWEATLSFFQRLRWRVWGEAPRPVKLDHPPGSLMIPGTPGHAA